jgi:ParB/RepB/Spo0J family partition protein
MGLDLSSLSDISALIRGQDTGNGIRKVKVDAIQPDPGQPRRRFDEVSLAELAQSIESIGMIQPPVVRTQDDGYLLISGERRWRAARQLGWEKVDVIVRDDLGARAQLVENIQREGLSHWEVYRVISAELATGITHAELAKALGKSRTWVTAYAAIDNMPAILVSALRDGRVTGLTALRGLQQLHIAKPELAAELLDGSAPIDQPMIDRATTQASCSPAVAGSDSSSPVCVDEAGCDALSLPPASRIADETPEQHPPGARQRFPTSGASLPIRILVVYEDASWVVDYHSQRAVDGVASVKLVSEKQGACFAPVSSLRLQSIELL